MRCIREQDSKELFYGGGRGGRGGWAGGAVSKTVDYNGWLTTKKLKKHLLKRPKADKET